MVVLYFTTSSNLTIKQTNSLGLDAHLGYILHDVAMPYLLIGAQYTGINTALSRSPATQGINASQTNNKWGLLVGAGMQAYLADNWLGSLEYDYVYRGTVTNTFVSTTLAPYAEMRSYRPNLSTLVARLAYRFEM